jgi:hypothetical protein
LPDSVNVYDSCELRAGWVPEYLNKSCFMHQGEQRSRSYASTYDFAKNSLIDPMTPLTGECEPSIPGVSMSTTRWPSSSNSLETWIPWSGAVFRRDPLALFTNYSWDCWSLKIHQTDRPPYRGFPTLAPSHHTRPRGWPS